MTDMDVPMHIRVDGGATMSVRAAHDKLNDKVESVQNMVHEMRVPDRILAVGAHKSRRVLPREVIADRLTTHPAKELNNPPQKLTLDVAKYPDIGEKLVIQEATPSNESFAAEECSLREIKMMRKQLGRLTVRISMLQDSIERRNKHESFVAKLLAGLSVVLLALYAFKR